MALVHANTPQVALLVLPAVAAVGLVAGAASSAPVARANGGGYRDVTALIPEATARVRGRPGFSKAVLLEADGATTKKNQRVTTATGITKWRFVYNNQTTPKFKYASAALYYARGRFGKFVKHRGPFLEDLNIPRAPKMTLTTAVAKLRAAGYKSGFYNVTLRHPLEGKPGPEPLYIFGFGPTAKNPFVGVGVRSGKVKPA
jgi:hypothetical protein